jgi:hypothetical protein
MANLSATALPSLAIEQGFYVEPPSSIAGAVAARVDLEPESRQLIVGSIGAGKTTQLIIARDMLRSYSDVEPLFIDISEQHDINSIRPGSLIAVVGTSIVAHFASPWTDELKPFRAWATGYWTSGEDYDADDDGSEFVQGQIVPPKREWPHIPDYIVQLLGKVVSTVVPPNKRIVCLVDSFDRLSDLAAFTAIIEQDVAVLKTHKIGVVIVGPVRSFAGFGRLDVDRFDKMHLQLPFDVANDPSAELFLRSVLRRRADSLILPDTVADAVVHYSGGVLRDLISIAKSAGEEAYVSGAERVSDTHVMSAVDSFGRALMIGLQPEEVTRLRHVDSTGSFVAVSENDFALIATRRVLQFTAGGRYFVHPALKQLLKQLP